MTIMYNEMNKTVRSRSCFTLEPGMVLYHRANYIHDRANSYGRVTIERIEDGMIYCKTNKGISRFLITDIGVFLFLEESESKKSDTKIIDGPKHLTEEEDRQYNRDLQDTIYKTEKNFFDRLVSTIKILHSAVLDDISMKKYGFIHAQEVHVSSQRNELNQLYDDDKRYVQILKSPYFAKLELGKYKVSKLYIGEVAVPESNIQVIDWRSPIANLYYTKNPVEYKKYDLSLIRKFDIFLGSFCGYYDSYQKDKQTEDTGIIDDFLLSVIKQKRGNQNLQDIIQTIQDKQYEIISMNSDQNICVQGCAGSGKTMILMHRISYMLFNNSDMNTDNITIITPNKQLNLELNELAGKLSLDQIQRKTIQESYLEIIEKYMIKNNISPQVHYFKQLKAYYENITSPFPLDIAMRRSLGTNFSMEFKQYLGSFQEYEAIFKNANKFVSAPLNRSNQKDFIIDFMEKTKVLTNIMEQSSRLGLLDNNKKVSKIKEDVNEKVKQEYLRYLYLLKKYKIIEESVQLTIDEVLNHQLGFKDVTGLNDRIVVGITDTKKRLINEHRRYERIVQLEQEIRLYLYQNLFMHRAESIIGNLKLTPTDLSTNDIFEFLNYYSLEYKRVAFLDDFQKGKRNSYLMAAWDAYLSNWKAANGLKEEVTYSFECFETLKLMIDLYGPLTTEKQWLFIDEGQDYATPFVEVFMSVYPNLTFNIFGDTKQRITKDFNSYYFETCAADSDFASYEINTNYRNCVEITSHINEKCNMEMIPIGLHGTLSEYKFDGTESVQWDKFRGRNIIIVKDEASYNQLITRLPLHLVNDVRFNDFSFSLDHVNVMTVIAVKGLEFENVLVFSDTMNQNEYYVACTRALSHLSTIA